MRDYLLGYTTGDWRPVSERTTAELMDFLADIEGGRMARRTGINGSATAEDVASRIRLELEIREKGLGA